MAIATVGQARFKSGKPGSFTLIALRDILFDIITVREAGKALRRRTLGSFRKTRMQSTDVHYRGFVLPNYNSGVFCLHLLAMRVVRLDPTVRGSADQALQLPEHQTSFSGS